MIYKIDVFFEFFGYKKQVKLMPTKQELQSAVQHTLQVNILVFGTPSMYWVWVHKTKMPSLVYGIHMDGCMEMEICIFPLLSTGFFILYEYVMHILYSSPVGGGDQF